ncbi:MAG: hypothetical protein AAB152_18800 [Candidatus Coatesbacteria bacterium]
MKRFVLIVCAGWTAAVLSGCATVTVEAPAGSPVALASTGKTLTRMESFKKWYFLWGMLPVSETSTAQDIKECGYKNVRVVTKMGVDDFLMSLLGIVPVIPCSRTVEIWGE